MSRIIRLSETCKWQNSYNISKLIFPFPLQRHNSNWHCPNETTEQKMSGGGGIAVAVNPAQNFILDDVSSWCGCSGEQSGEKAFHTGCRRGCGRLTTFSASPNSHSVSSILFTSPTSPNQTTKVQKVQTCLNKSTESTEEIWKTLPTRLHNLWSFYETKMQHGPSIKIVNWDSFAV